MNEAGAPVRQAVMDAIAAAEGLAAEGVEGVEGRRGGGAEGRILKGGANREVFSLVFKKRQEEHSTAM